MITGEISEIKIGHDILFARRAEKATIEVKKQSEDGYRITAKDGKYAVSYGKVSDYFRAMPILLEAIEKGNDIDVSAKPQIDELCAMFDSSRGAVHSVDMVKKFIRELAMFGFNQLMLYTEDTIKIDDYPYFGYMRGAYTKDEIKELVAYAEYFGIEMIPCLELLSHMERPLRWGAHSGMRNSDRTMLVGADATYKFIEAYIATVRECYKSKHIHIGFDEAPDLAEGRYADIHGYRNAMDVFTEHLQKVVAIAEKYDFRPMIWNDMFFSICIKPGQAYEDVEFTDEVINAVPQNVDIVYWDYSNIDSLRVERRIEATRRLKHDVVYAGGIWTMSGLCADQEMSWYTGYNASHACKKVGCKRVIVTMWGDNGGECPVESTLPGLCMFGEHRFMEGDPTEEEVSATFRRIVGMELQDFLALGLDDNYPRNLCHYHNACLTKQIMYQDVLLGMFDEIISRYDGCKKHFEDCYARLCKVKPTEEYALLFDYYTKLAKVLVSKCDIGLRLVKAYKANDKKALQALVNELHTLQEDCIAFDEAASALWYHDNKPQGFEVVDLRLGGIANRIHRASARVQAFIDGKISSIPEFEEERLYYDMPGREKEFPLYSFWSFSPIFTANGV